MKLNSISSLMRISALAVLLFSFSQSFGQVPVFNTVTLFPHQKLHTHGSSVVELPNGDLMIAWFQGSGERWSDDVKIMGTRRKKGSKTWSKPFELADAKEFPDCNPVLFVDAKKRLWVMWYTVMANQWETSLIRYKYSTNYQTMAGAPKWDWQDDLLMKPGDKSERGISANDKFVSSVKKQIEDYGNYLATSVGPQAKTQWLNSSNIRLSRAKGEDYIRAGYIYNADSTKHEDAQVGYPYFQRMGWQTRHKPFTTSTGRILIPLYSDGFGFSIMTYTDDLGENWKFSTPLVGGGNIQPSIAVKKSGELVAYMRDNGGGPKVLHMSSSKDNGATWSTVNDSSIPNGGTAADIVTLKNGHWVIIYNASDRTTVTVALSEDEGKTWGWTKTVITGDKISASYPAIIEGKDGLLHVSHSYQLPNKQESINYVNFNEAWIKAK